MNADPKCRGSAALRSAAEVSADQQVRPTGERWITIGEVQWPWFVYEMSAGTPNGYKIIWRGGVGIFQPVQFRTAEHLCWAIERRLHLSRLEWIAMASEPTRGLFGGTILKVLVRRTNRADLS